MYEFRKLKKEFGKLKKDVFAILIYGSYAIGRTNKRSDIDVCLVLKTNNEDKIKEVYKKTLILSSKSEKYDIKIFELLPLKIKFEVIDSGKTIYTKNMQELQEYFYFYRKLWQDQSVNWLEKKQLV